MLIERLKDAYGVNNPIFTNEILKVMQDFSRPTIYRFIDEAIKDGALARFYPGIYYIPKMTLIGMSIPSVERVITKKYLRDGDEVFGIYGRWILELNFDLSTQVPNTIEIITNKASRAIRETEMGGRRVVIRKSRLPITKENVSAYTLLELFSIIDLREYNKRVQRCVLQYIEERKITKDSILNIAGAFPAKAIKNLVISGVLSGIA